MDEIKQPMELPVPTPPTVSFLHRTLTGVEKIIAEFTEYETNMFQMLGYVCGMSTCSFSLLRGALSLSEVGEPLS